MEKIKRKLNGLLILSASLLLIGAQWMQMRPQSILAGSVFLAGSVVFVGCIIVMGVDVVKNRNKGDKKVA